MKRMYTHNERMQRFVERWPAIVLWASLIGVLLTFTFLGNCEMTRSCSKHAATFVKASAFDAMRQYVEANK